MPMLETYVCANRLGRASFPLLEAQVSEITETLNEPETASFSIPQDAQYANTIDGVVSEIQIREVADDGTSSVAFQGTVTKEKGDQHKADFECSGLLSLFDRRIIDRASLTFSAVDQFYIGSQLIAYAQSEANQQRRNFNIQNATFTNSGHTRSRNYKRNEHAKILDLLQEFPKLSDGFDFSIEITGDGARFWTPYYPKKGSLKPELTLQFDDIGSRGMSKYEYTRDWLKVTTHQYVTGGSSGGIKFEQNYEDTLASIAWNAVLQAVSSEGGENDTVWLLEKAVKKVNSRKASIYQPTVTCQRTPIDYWKLVKVGDRIPLVISIGRAPVSSNKRVIQKKLNVADDTVDITFESEDQAA